MKMTRQKPKKKNKSEITNLPYKDFRTTITKMFTKHERKVDGFSENFKKEKN